MEIDLSFIGKPQRYELIDGPFDGSSIQIACDLFELPPKSITIQCDPEKSRGSVAEKYVFDRRLDYDDTGEPFEETIAYFYSSK